MKTATNIKTGKEYIILMDKKIINTTNEQDGQEMIIYQDMDKNIFVREVEEFYKKFKINDQEEMTANQVLKTALVKRGYEGLYSPGGCGCDLQHLFCCGEYPGDCKPGYKHPARGEDEDYHISPERI